jgi:hypothetical protein
MEPLRHGAAADDGAALDHPDGEAGGGQIAGAGQPVVAGADNDDIAIRGHSHPSLPHS